jgi:hypothetical protein
VASILDGICARRVGVRIYGLGAILLGLEGLVWRDFATLRQPESNDLLPPTAWAYVVAVAPLLAGLAIQWRRFAGPGALVLTVLYTLAVTAGGLVAYAYCAQRDQLRPDRICVGDGGPGAGRETTRAQELIHV